MAAFTERDEIEVELRYIQRVRSMQPSAPGLRKLDDQEAELKRRLSALDDVSLPGTGSVSLTSAPRHRRAGF